MESLMYMYNLLTTKKRDQDRGRGTEIETERYVEKKLGRQRER